MIRKTTAILVFFIRMFVVLLFLFSLYKLDLFYFVFLMMIVAICAIGIAIFTELDYFFIIVLARRSKKLLNEIADRRDLDDSVRCGASNTCSNIIANNVRRQHYQSIEWMRRYLNYLPEESAIKAIKLINLTRISKIINIFPILVLIFGVGLIEYADSNSIEYSYIILILLIIALFVLVQFSDELMDYPIELVLARRGRNIIDEIIDSDSIDNDIKSDARSVCNDKSGLSLYDRYIEWMRLNMDKLPAELSIKIKKEIWLIRLAKGLTALIVILLLFGFMILAYVYYL